MAKARALDKRRKSIRNIRKITRTMEMSVSGRAVVGVIPLRVGQGNPANSLFVV